MERGQGLERPGPSRPPDLDWTLVGYRRGLTGRQQGLTMLDVMEGSITMDSEDEEEMSLAGQRRGESDRVRTEEGRVAGSGRQNIPLVVKCYNCEEKGHIERNCDQPKKPKRCHRCREEGHLIKAVVQIQAFKKERGIRPECRMKLKEGPARGGLVQ